MRFNTSRLLSLPLAAIIGALVGALTGFAFAGVIASAFGWRTSFFVWGAAGGPAIAMFAPSLGLYLQYAVMDRVPAGRGWMGAAAAVIALVLANLLPLVGVVFLGWSLLTVLLLYWLENGIVGAYNVARMALAGGETAQMPDTYLTGAYDIAGTMIGVAERSAMPDPARVRAGDVIVGGVAPPPPVSRPLSRRLLVSRLAAGATVIANLSASNVVVGKDAYRHQLAANQSARCLAAYLYSAAGLGESTTDLAWDGHALIYENGTLVAEARRFADAPQLAAADVDLGRLLADRMRQNTFGEAARRHAGETARFRVVEFSLPLPKGNLALERRIEGDHAAGDQEEHGGRQHQPLYQDHPAHAVDVERRPGERVQLRVDDVGGVVVEGSADRRWSGIGDAGRDHEDQGRPRDLRTQPCQDRPDEDRDPVTDRRQGVGGHQVVGAVGELGEHREVERPHHRERHGGGVGRRGALPRIRSDRRPIRARCGTGRDDCHRRGWSTFFSPAPASEALDVSVRTRLFRQT